MKLNDEIIKKIVNELFELYHNSEIREPIIKNFFRNMGLIMKIKCGNF